MKLLVLSRFDRLGASSRLRTLQYLPWLQRAGIDAVHHALLSDAYVRALYERKRVPLEVLKGYLGRLAILLRAGQFDLVLVEKEALPWLPALFETSLFPADVPLVMDFDDALFHRYDRHRSWIVRKALGSKIDTLMKRCAMVTAGNRYLHDRAVSAGCRRVEVIPTVVDLERYGSVREDRARDREVVVGWIGSPATAHYLREVAQPLAQLAARHPIRCVAIGARADQTASTPFVAAPWEERTEVEMLHSLDIGIMPLPDGPWERGKCGYKLIQYMACGVPVVASAVGANMDIVRDGENGFLAGSSAAWSEAVARLIVDPSLRRQMGSAGRYSVEREFCVQVQAPRLIDLLRNVANR